MYSFISYRIDAVSKKLLINIFIVSPAFATEPSATTGVVVNHQQHPVLAQKAAVEVEELLNRYDEVIVVVTLLDQDPADLEVELAALAVPNVVRPEDEDASIVDGVLSAREVAGRPDPDRYLAHQDVDPLVRVREVRVRHPDRQDLRQEVERDPDLDLELLDTLATQGNNYRAQIFIIRKIFNIFYYC